MSDKSKIDPREVADRMRKSVYENHGPDAVKQAEILERTGKKPEALQVLKSLDEKRLGGGVKKSVESAIARLSK